MPFTAVGERYRTVAAQLAAQPKERDVTLLAVSKTFGLEAVEAAWAAGARCFGENYAQEGAQKCRAFRGRHPDADVAWHFIGPLQSNKTRLVATHFDWVQSIDREKIARRLSEQRPADLAPLNVLIEVNADEEEGKSGVRFEEIAALAAVIDSLPNLVLRGLMAIPEAQSEDGGRRAFRRMKAAFDELASRYPTVDTLSMGMSADWPTAVEEGSTLIRVGSAIFGARHYATA